VSVSPVLEPVVNSESPSVSLESVSVVEVLTVPVVSGRVVASV
jgi:hypothetical protein